MRATFIIIMYNNELIVIDILFTLQRFCTLSCNVHTFCRGSPKDQHITCGEHVHGGSDVWLKMLKTLLYQTYTKHLTFQEKQIVRCSKCTQYNVILIL